MHNRWSFLLSFVKLLIIDKRNFSICSGYLLQSVQCLALPFEPLIRLLGIFQGLDPRFLSFFYHVQEYPNPGLVNCFMSSDRSFFSFLYSLVLVYKYQNRDHYICNFKCHRQKKYTMAFKANKPHGYQYTENRALTVQNLFVVSVRHCLTFLRPPGSPPTPV